MAILADSEAILKSVRRRGKSKADEKLHVLRGPSGDRRSTTAPAEVTPLSDLPPAARARLESLQSRCERFRSRSVDRECNRQGGGTGLISRVREVGQSGGLRAEEAAVLAFLEAVEAGDAEQSDGAGSPRRFGPPSAPPLRAA